MPSEAEKTPVDAPPPARPLRTAACFAAWGLPLTAWALACVSQAHKLGRYMDDWCFPVIYSYTGQPDWSSSPFRIFPYFWRPLLQLFLYAGTLLWGHETIGHWFSAVAHAGVAALVYLLGTRLNVRRRAAAAAALLFLLFPFHYEVIFWWTAVTTSLGAACAIWLLHASVSYSRRPTTGRLMLLTLIAFAVPCWYEQASAAVAGLPLVMLAASPPSRPVRARLWSTAVAVTAAGVMQILYIALLRATAPTWARGSADSLTTFDQIPARLELVANTVRTWFTEGVRYKCVGMAGFGLKELDTRQGLVALGLLGITAGFWVVWWTFRGDTRRRDEGEVWWARLAAGIGAGLGVFVVSWLPVAMIKWQIVEARTHYFPAVGLALALAFVLEGLSRLGERPWLVPLRAAVGLALAMGIWISTLGLFGWQVCMRERNRADQSQYEQVQRMFPVLPPSTVFLPLADVYRSAGVRGPQFDGSLCGWVNAPWASTRIVKIIYRREDVFIAPCTVWGPPRTQRFTPDDLNTLRELRMEKAPFPAGSSETVWTDTVPFYIDSEGRVVLVSALTARPADTKAGGEVTIRFPMVDAALKADPRWPTTNWPLPGD